tara:strand:+ start:5472 stop:6194 length:723 start_codon:yes stop_codon:yes gene_type:complete
MSYKTFSAIALLGALVTGLAAPASAGDDISERRSISVSGQGQAYGTPDQATINAGVQTRAKTLAAATAENQAAIARLMGALESEGVKAQDIQTSDYSVWPEQRHDPRGEESPTVTGYGVRNTVSVKVRELDRLGEILAKLTDAGANSINGINFGVADSSALEAQARAAAMDDARNKAAALAKLAGVRLGEVLVISMSSSGGYPVPVSNARFQMAEAAMAPAISAGQLSVSIQVQVTYAIE